MPVMSKDFRLVFLGSPDYALPSLVALNTAFPGTLVGILTKPDQPKGRGQLLAPTPIKTWGLEHYIPVFTPHTKSEVHQALCELRPDLVIVIAYGMILPPESVSQFFCVNAHGSILPSYRGASPVQAALLNGDAQTGVTLIRMNDKMDDGDMLWTAPLTIENEENFGSLFDRLSHLSAEALVAFVQDAWLTAQITAHPQPTQGISYCQKITKTDTELTASDSPETWYRKIKAFSPQPGAFFQTAKGPVKILEARYSSHEGLTYVTVQPPGKKPMPYRDYCLGHSEGLPHAR